MLLPLLKELKSYMISVISKNKAVEDEIFAERQKNEKNQPEKSQCVDVIMKRKQEEYK